jgi:hypothetical protein
VKNDLERMILLAELESVHDPTSPEEIQSLPAEAFSKELPVVSHCSIPRSLCIESDVLADALLTATEFITYPAPQSGPQQDTSAWGSNQDYSEDDDTAEPIEERGSKSRRLSYSRIGAAITAELAGIDSASFRVEEAVSEARYKCASHRKVKSIDHVPMDGRCEAISTETVAISSQPRRSPRLTKSLIS